MSGFKLRFINRRARHPTDPSLEVFYLDNQDIVVTENDLISRESKYVWHYNSPLRVVGAMYSAGRLVEFDRAVSTAFPLTERSPPVTPFCIGRLFWGNHHELCAAPQKITDGLLSAVRDSWVVSISDISPGRWELTAFPASVNPPNYVTYAWDTERECGVKFEQCYAATDEGNVGIGTVQPWEKLLFVELSRLGGMYAVVCIGAVCVAIWNVTIGAWVGPPFDRRICDSVLGLRFLEMIQAGDDFPTVRSLEALDRPVLFRWCGRIGMLHIPNRCDVSPK